MNRLALIVLLAVAGVLSPAGAQPFTFQRVTPSGTIYLFACSPQGDVQRMFLVTQAGAIDVIDLATGVVRSRFLTISTIGSGIEAGLLGMAFHPQYQQNGFFYVYYTTPSARVIARYHVSSNPDVADATSATMVLNLPLQSSGLHQGGWLGFGPDGLLYNAWGNNGGTANGQLITNNLLGKILRIDVNGPDGVPGTPDDDGFPADAGRNYTIPPTNPFVGVAGDDEIWAYGLRNPFRCSFDRQTGDFWIGDVGDYREEVNTSAAGLGAGLNYGYPCRDGNICGAFGAGAPCTCTSAGFTEPVYVYQRTTTGVAVIGGYVYRGCALPSLRGQYIFADYAEGKVRALRLVNGAVVEARALLSSPTLGNIRSMGEDASGELYMCASTGVFRLAPVTPDCNANGLIDGCEITAGAAPDVNRNGVIDPCEHPWPCHADYNQDGDISTDRDIEDFFACLGGRCCAVCGSADFDGDGDVGTDRDIEAFFRVLGGGAC